MEKSYRIKANVGKDQYLSVNLKRDIDFYEVLSLKIEQEKLYKLHSSNYGVIVGRVLANDAFGIPNAKVSVFIPISNGDRLRSEISELYPYLSVNSYGNDNIRFNTLPNYQVKKCYKPVGTFPSKRNVLDEDVIIEVYDKYYKYTTVTNNAGDYMIFGVPTGEQVMHVDIDLSDIGVLSQRPTDFIYKGYSVDLFESPSDFKQSTNLNDLPQIITENTSVNVYPLWGDKSKDEISITRNDVRIQYKFEPTCVFIGSVITDSSTNSISQTCTPSIHMGEASQLMPSEGTIEMIRKTVFDNVEEFSIKGNRLIDSDGVWCYQIPMNLDYVCTDEYGNIVPTDNPTKGIPTRARVRFRFTLNESENESLSSHKARYLVPNNPPFFYNEYSPYVKNGVDYYEFGTKTDDECFRDLLWNKVYSVKSYIPRIQKPFGNEGEKSSEYVAIKGVNKKGASDINPLPFNKLNLNFAIPSYYILREMWKGEDDLMGSLKKFWGFLNGNHVPYSIDSIREKVMEETDAVGLDFYNDWLNGCLYFPSWYWYLFARKSDNEISEEKYESQFCDCDKSAEEYDDSTLCVLNNCSLLYNDEELNISSKYNNRSDIESSFTKLVYGSVKFKNGIIKKVVNKDGLSIYYYSCGQHRFDSKKSKLMEEGAEYEEFVRLFSTDIILLGSLSDCDIHGIPKISSNLPSTTSNIPPMGRLKPPVTDDEEETIDSKTFKENKPTVNGMHWGEYWLKDGEIHNALNDEKYYGTYKTIFGSGLFFGLTPISYSSSFSLGSITEAIIRAIIGIFGDRTSNWNSPLVLPGADISILETIWGGQHGFDDFLVPYTDAKSCVNAERICELGVTNDSEVNVPINETEESQIKYRIYSQMDGLITRRELLDIDTRSLFATLNSDKLLVKIDSDATGYKTYNLRCLYPINFDGRLEEAARRYTSPVEGEDLSSYDARNKDYMDFRFGSTKDDISYIMYNSYGRGTRGGRVIIENTPNSIRHFYGERNGENTWAPFSFPVYDNSFYFYFGINPAHNAISELNKNFLSKCTKDKKDKLGLKVLATSSDLCTEPNGKITFTVNGANVPVKVSLLNSNNEELVSEDESLKYETKNVVAKDGLKNGKYVLTITDFLGATITEEVVLKAEKMKAHFSVVSSIQTEYREGMKASICDNKQYGILKITSYELYGATYNIDSLPTPLVVQQSKIVFLEHGHYKITIALSRNEGSESINDYYCGFKDNEVMFGKPGDFTLRIESPSCKQNFDEYSFRISDTGESEMYINTMPLKFFVGLSENRLETYAKHFHDGNKQETVNSVRGWFGVHNPKNYDESFWGDYTDENYKKAWANEISKSNESNLLNLKFRKLFNVASNVYISNGTANKFYANVSGNKILLRASYPLYDKFGEKENVDTFNSFITCNKGETQNCPENSANIVAGNYRFTDNDGRPLFDENSVTGYKFNPKYKNSKNTAGNYFAIFSNNANYISNCQKSSVYKKVNAIPYGANDLSEYKLCIGDDSKGYTLPKVYETNPFFKTEFIDRRLDYDLAYVTPCTTTDTSYGIDRTWANGRISGTTYNGIEMAYTGQYVIASDYGNTEYIYDASKMTISLNDSVKDKKLYKSELVYGGTRPLDLRALYYSKNRKNIPEETVNNDGIKVHNHSSDAVLNGNEFDNFGLSQNKSIILGYPTKRIIDIYNIPYGNGSYKWNAQSCLYNANFENYSSIKALGSGVVSNECNFDNNSIEINTNKVIYKVKNAEEYLFAANSFEHISKLKTPSVNGLSPMLKGVKLIIDGEGHENINKMKLTKDKSLSEVFETIGETVLPLADNIEVNKQNLMESGAKFIGIGLYHILENSSFDNLLKRERIFNISNYYNIKDIVFEPDRSEGDWIKINQEGDYKSETLNFLMSSSAFTYDEISTGSTQIIVNLGDTVTYSPTIKNTGVQIKLSVVLSGNNVLLSESGDSAKITLSIVLKDGINYELNFSINKDGIINNIN